MGRESLRPCIVISCCIGFDPCRYDGSKTPSPVAAQVQSNADRIPVCPEVETGPGILWDLLHSRVIRFLEPGLLNPAFFAPYLAEPADLPEERTDRGRDVWKGRNAPAVQEDIRQNYG